MVDFLVFNSVYWKNSAPSNGVNRVTRKNSSQKQEKMVEFLVFHSVYWKKSAPSNGVNRVNGMNRFALRTGFRNHTPFAPVKEYKITNFSEKIKSFDGTNRFAKSKSIDIVKI